MSISAWTATLTTIVEIFTIHAWQPLRKKQISPYLSDISGLQKSFGTFIPEINVPSLNCFENCGSNIMSSAHMFNRIQRYFDQLLRLLKLLDVALLFILIVFECLFTFL